MNDSEVPPSESSSHRAPWNKGKLPGAKPPLGPSHVWSIRTKLQVDRSTRDLALFNLAVDSKLRGCDVVAIRVDDVAPNGYTLYRATVRQRKTGRPVRFELTDQTRQAIDDYMKLAERKPGQFFFAGRGGGESRSLTTRQYARLVGEWIASIGLDPPAAVSDFFSCNFIRLRRWIRRSSSMPVQRRMAVFWRVDHNDGQASLCGVVAGQALTSLEPGWHADGRGLYLPVTTSGARHWVLRTVIKGGRRCEIGLGSLHDVTLDEARDKASEVRRAARMGRDPIMDRRARAAATVTFRQAFDRFFVL